MHYRHVLQDPRWLFWLLQLAGWSAWCLSSYFGVLVFSEPPDAYALYLPLVSVIGFAITLILRALYRQSWEHPPWQRALAMLFGSYLAALLWIIARANIFYLMFPGEKGIMKEGGSEWAGYFSSSIGAFWVMLVWSALYAGIKYYLLMQEEQQRGLRALSMAHESQLKMLRYQLNPHFLFNTLNAISTLILARETQQANRMVTGLSRFLRYSLDNDPMQRVTVAEELDAIRLYLDIEKARFDERLRLHLRVDPEVNQALMPSLLLQPLVENAIKYAIAASVNGGRIAISAEALGDELVLCVADDGPGLEPGSTRSGRAGGVGLRNCRERLQQLYGDRQSFRLSVTEPHGLTITIHLPLEKQGDRAS
jgi:two-component sensor histidine kinase